MSRTVDLLPLRLEGDVLTGAPTDERLRSLRIELPRLPLSLLVETPERFELSLLLLRLEDPLKLLRLDGELLRLEDPLKLLRLDGELLRLEDPLKLLRLDGELLWLEDPLKLLRLDGELLWLLLLRLDDDELWLLPPRLPPPRCA